MIHCHFGHLGILGMQLREIGAIQGRLYTTFHAWDITEYLTEAGPQAYQELFHKGERFLPISNYWKNRLIELGCDPAKITVHRMGIDCQAFTFIPRHLQQGQPVQIVSVARLVEKKGIEYGIRAIAQLKQQQPNIQYTIIGDGDLQDPLQTLIRELQVTDIVHLLGWRQQTEIIAILNDAHILLAPSVTGQKGDQEGIPVALMEAMAMGLPVVSTQYSGIPELVENGVSGYLVPERDCDAIAHQLNELIEHPQRWQQMGQAGRSAVESHYNVHQLTEKLSEFYLAS